MEVNLDNLLRTYLFDLIIKRCHSFNTLTVVNLFKRHEMKFPQVLAKDFNLSNYNKIGDHYRIMVVNQV